MRCYIYLLRCFALSRNCRYNEVLQTILFNDVQPFFLLFHNNSVLIVVLLGFFAVPSLFMRAYDDKF